MRIARWLLGGGREHVGLVLGSDTSGKTTFLYRLKLKEAVQALPTIGFNVETIDYPDGEKVTLWDVGGCDAIRPLIRHYMTQDRFLIFIQSCTDTNPDRVEFSLEYLRMGLNMMLEYEAKHMFIIFNKQDLLSEEERPKIVKDLKAKIEAEIKPYTDKLDIKILDTPGLSALWGCQVHNVMDEIRKTLKPRNAAKDTKAEIELREKGPGEEELRNKIRTANAESADANTFWESFLDGSLEAWDHYTHLRAGFFIMHDCFGKGVGVLECADEFMTHLNRLREGNPERFRNTAHKTMTIFWLHQIQVAAIEYQAHFHPGIFPSREAYVDIVFSAPHLMNSNLWRAYYSKDLLFSPLARANYSLPDLQPLPTIKQVTSTPLQEKVVDDVDRLPRFAFSVIQKTLSSKLRRGGVVKQALEALQSSTMRLRAADSSIPPYSETQAYFWIQTIHAYTRSLGTESSGSHFTTYEAFKSLFDIKGDEWKEYYSQSTWDSIAARMTFVNPDKKPLPNIFNLPSQARKDLAVSQMINATNNRSTNTHLPPSEDLDFLAAILIDEAKLIPESELNVASHASLITFLFNRLTEKTKSTMTSTKRGDASLASSTALEVAKWTGLTQAMFWVQQIQIALAERKEMGFEEFIKGNSVLAFEELPFVYYSPQLWGSVEARDGYVMPDRRVLSSIVPGKVKQ
ncbi:ubiquitin thiolesterase L3 [Fusarium phyllophilum]|uniref:Ubiquitin thiolesterase L3 n=1 Tax=Fusarium phyllophilum TaxID=47803 RepID=A0A8H5MKR0_9HYPO|nr:ubiquitin thiolesterase L3 [Fusarium phyllophilum]